MGFAQTLKISLQEPSLSHTQQPRKNTVAPSLSSCTDLRFLAETKPLKVERDRNDLGVRTILRSAHFDDRFLQRARVADVVIESMARAGAKRIMEHHNDEFLNAYFIVGEKPVDLVTTDGTVKGYVGFPMIWTSPRVPTHNYGIVMQALEKSNRPLRYPQPTIGAVWTYIPKPIEEGPPEASHRGDILIGISKAQASIPGASEQQQLAFAHIAAAILETDSSGWKAVASGFYGHTDYLLFAGSAASSTKDDPNVNMKLHTVHGTVIFV